LCGRLPGTAAERILTMMADRAIIVAMTTKTMTDCSLAVIILPSGRFSGLCEGKRVSMNCSICRSLSQHTTSRRRGGGLIFLLIFLYLSAGDADGQVVGVAGVVLPVYPPGVAAERVAQHAQVLGRLDHELAGVALGDLDVAVEDGRVAE